MAYQIRLVQGDITLRPVEAIVNAANTQLVLGSGVAGSIRIRGGFAIQQECDVLAPIGLGMVAITGAGRLPMKYILHAATMHPGGYSTPEVVRRCVANAIQAAEERGITTLALPALGCGIGGLPFKLGIGAILEELRNYREVCYHLGMVELVLYSLVEFTEAERVAIAMGIAVGP